MPASTCWPVKSSDPNWPSAVKKCACTRGTAPLHGGLGAAIWSGLVTAGRNLLPTTLSRTIRRGRPSPRRGRASLHVVTRSQVPPSEPSRAELGADQAHGHYAQRDQPTPQG